MQGTDASWFLTYIYYLYDCGVNCKVTYEEKQVNMEQNGKGYGLALQNDENSTILSVTAYKQPYVEVTVLILMIVVGE